MANPDLAPVPPPFSRAPTSQALEAFRLQALGRASGSRRVDGNALALQFDGPLTFDTWIEAIQGARRFVHFENYILRDDPVGRRFRDAMVAKAREGVQVRVLYDWVGCWATPRKYWAPFREAGVEVRAFNRPTIRDPLGVLQRDHRKLVCVDGSLAFVGGFCVGQEWAGSAKSPPWRDTGIEMRGPAAAVAGWSFERIWATLGDPIPPEVQVHPDQVAAQGKASCWVFEGLPRRSRVLRSTLLVAAAARRRIWITDPYFVAPRTVAEALRAAARDGVDVRILVPSKNNWPWVGSLSRGGYRELLRSGVRLFEWQGSMIHAKTLVSDGIWARVGSSNMNSASLLGNWEIDIGVLDQDFARQMEGLFLADLASAVEIVLPGRASTSRRTDVAAREVSAGSASLEPPESLQGRLELWRAGGGSSGSTGSRIADLVRAGSTLGNAIAGRRTLGREDRALLGALALALLLVTVLAFFFPTVVAGVVAVLSGWLGLVVGVRVVVQRRAARLGHGVDTFEDRGVE